MLPLYVSVYFGFFFLLDTSFPELFGKVSIPSTIKSICQIKAKEEKSQNN